MVGRTRSERRAAERRARDAERAVHEYLARRREPPETRRAAIEELGARLALIDEELEDATPIEELLLLQQRRDLGLQLRSLSGAADADRLETEFVAVAAWYGASRGWGFETWVELGVPPEVLDAAGIRRSSA